MRDLSHNIGAVRALIPAVQSAATEGAAIDSLGFESIAFIVNTGAIVGSGDFGVNVRESDPTISGDFTDASGTVTDSTA
jgi:hypothetical protein